MPRPARVVIAAAGVATVAIAVAAVGSIVLAVPAEPPSPTTTVTADDGTEIVLDWADYPADAWEDPADVLAAPRAEVVEAVADEQLLALQAAVEPVAPELEWGNVGWDFDHVPSLAPGNGYGGPTLHRIFNSPTNLGADFGRDADWPAIVVAVEARLAELGYGELEWQHDRAPFAEESPAERDADVVARYGSLDTDEMWLWSGRAHAGSMWVWVAIWDARRDTAPDEPWRDAESGASLLVGGMVVAEADVPAYVEGIGPFEGLARPPEVG